MLARGVVYSDARSGAVESETMFYGTGCAGMLKSDAVGDGRRLHDVMGYGGMLV